MYNIYCLRAKPDQPPWARLNNSPDCMTVAVVGATDEDDARLLASIQCGDEGMEAWRSKDPDYLRVELVGTGPQRRVIATDISS